MEGLVCKGSAVDKAGATDDNAGCASDPPLPVAAKNDDGVFVDAAEADDDGIPM
jgi:hypothetical protein